MKHEVIMGTDVLNKNGVIIDYNKETLQISDQKLVLIKWKYKKM